MGSFHSKPTSTMNHIQMKGKKSQRDEMKALSVKQATSESLSLYSKKDEMADVETKQTNSWTNNQQFKQSRDFMRMSKSKLEKKKNELLTRKRLEESAAIRRQRDKSLKEEFSRRFEAINSTKEQTELKEQSLRIKAETPKPKIRATRNRDIDKSSNDNLDKTQEQCSKNARN